MKTGLVSLVHIHMCYATTAIGVITPDAVVPYRRKEPLRSIKVMLDLFFLFCNRVTVKTIKVTVDSREHLSLLNGSLEAPDLPATSNLFI